MSKAKNQGHEGRVHEPTFGDGWALRGSENVLDGRRCYQVFSTDTKVGLSVTQEGCEVSDKYDMPSGGIGSDPLTQFTQELGQLERELEIVLS